MINELCSDIASYTDLILHVDGGCEPKNPGGIATAGWVIYDGTNSTSVLVEEGSVARDGGPLATNNYGEYSALGFALDYLESHGWRGSLFVKADSKLLVEQVQRRWKCNLEHLRELRDRIWDLMLSLNLQLVNPSDPLPEEGKNPMRLEWVPREHNQRANDLCRLAYQEHIASKQSAKGSKKG